MNWLLRRAALRFYLRHPWQLALALAGISLGVAVYVGVELANDSAARAFELSAATVRGQTTHRLVPIGAELDERLYRELVVERGIAAATPVIEAEVGIAARPGRTYPLLGIDPLPEAALRGVASFAFAGTRGGGLASIAELVTSPGTVLLPNALATELGVVAGDSVDLVVAGRAATVRVLGMTPAIAGDVRAEPPIIADVATAQELLRSTGAISRIDLKLTAAQAETLAATPPAGTALVAADLQNSAFAELARAFRTNLSALGLLALVVGTFMIYGTMSFAIVQRRSTLGILRALGLSRQELLGSVLLEALALATVATALGLLVGYWLSRALVELVLRSIGDFYFRTAVTAAAPSPWLYLQGAVLGVGATLLAAAKPAIDAARAVPAAVLRRADLERGSRRGMRLGAAASVPVLGASGLLLAFGPQDLYGAFAGLFGVIAAAALVIPAATVVLMRGVELVAQRWLRLPGVLALRGVTASLSRTGVATAALAVAVATVNGVGLMISSFRTSLVDWLSTTLTADLYVSFDGDGANLTEAQFRGLEAIDGVASVGLTRTVALPTRYGTVALRAVQPDARGWGLSIVSGDPTESLDAVGRGAGVVASERLAFARGLRVGDELTLPSPGGDQHVPIVGVFRDFNTGSYSVVMALDRYRSSWHDERLSGVGIRVRSDASIGAVETFLRALLPDAPRVRSSAAIQRLSLEVFDRTFKITEVLRVLAAVVAFLGVLSALLSIELERARELAVLRALGFTPRELTTTLLTQTGLLGAAAGLAAMPLGTALAALLVYVINRRSFGWTMSLAVTPGPLLAGLGLALVAALLAGIYPAWRASRIELGSALREE